jgi:hypothetical protein
MAAAVSTTRLRFGVLVASVALLGCDGGDSGPTRGRTPGETIPAAEPARAPLCAPLRSRVVGRVVTRAATELSGLAVSRSQAGVLWTHNDSGDRARILALAPDGGLIADVAVSGAENVDWEDLAIGQGDGGDVLYLGDIGDNLAVRSAVVVYRVPEPPLRGGAPSATGPARRLVLRYPDGPHDAEALLVDPASGALVIATKGFRGASRLYVADRPSSTTATTLRAVGEVRLEEPALITAGDVSADGRTIALRTYESVFVWSRHRNEPLAAAVRRPPCTAPADLLVEGQGEALALTSDGTAFYTVPEGERPALRRHAPED